MKRKIAFLTRSFGAGGLERLVALFVNSLPAAEFDPIVVSLKPADEASSWITRKDTPVYSVGQRKGNDWKAVQRLAKILRDENVTLLQSHNWGSLIEGAIACWKTGIPQIHTEHGQQQRDGNAVSGLKYKLHRRLRIEAFKRCSNVIACAESVREGIQREWGYNGSNLEFIPNGCQPLSGCGNAIRKSLGIPRDTVVFGAVGRLVELKGFDVLIKAFSNLISKGFKASLVIVGDGPLQAQLEDQIATSRISDNVKLVGFQSDIGDWLNAFDVFVNSSHTEAMSIAILEAMSAGLPIIASDVGDSKTLVEGGAGAGGITVTAKNSESLCKAMSHLCEDKTLRMQLGRNAKSRFESDYSLDKMVERYSAIYRSIRCKTSVQR